MDGSRETRDGQIRSNLHCLCVFAPLRDSFLFAGRAIKNITEKSSRKDAKARRTVHSEPPMEADGIHPQITQICADYFAPTQQILICKNLFNLWMEVGHSNSWIGAMVRSLTARFAMLAASAQGNAHGAPSCRSATRRP